MKEQEIRGLIGRVKRGAMSRRDFVQRMIAVGLTAPMAGTMLAHNGVAFAQSIFDYTPTKAGGGGTVKLLQWQPASQLNPHFAVGSADQHAIYLFYEPLASWDEDGNLSAVLAEELPTLENGGVAQDGTSVTWKLKRGVTWHDGTPFTADDCLFTAEFASDPETLAYTMGTYRDVQVEKIDDHTIRVNFRKPTPFWPDAFVGTRGLILPKHLYQDYRGARAKDAPMNLRPVGTGPFMITNFVPGDLISARANPNYHVPNRPYFDAIEMKGGGDAASAARAVLQTGEYDFAWNLAVEDEILDSMTTSGRGEVRLIAGANIEHLQLNTTDPWTEVDGERASATTQHPAFKDKAVREALALLVDRAAIAEFIYGRSGEATGNFINTPDRFTSKNTSWEFNIDKANGILDAAGWERGRDGIRAKDGVKLSLVFQSPTAGQRQKTQTVVKQACEEAGIAMELKAVAPGIFFSADPGNPDTFAHFYCDIQMYTSPMREPDPGLFMQQFLSSEIAAKANNWQLRNVTRWRNAEFDELAAAAAVEMDPVKRADMFIRMNDLVVGDVVVIPLIYRKVAAGMRKGLKAPLSTWTSYLWRVSDWHYDA